MAFKTFNRALYAEIEGTEGATTTPDDLSSPPTYIETTDPTFSVTNQMFERDPTTGSITDVSQTVPGVGAGLDEASAVIEFSFSVELTGSGNPGSPPVWGRLLKACGFTEVECAVCTTEAAITGTAQAPHLFHDREHLSDHADAAHGYDGGQCLGRCVGDYFQNVAGSYLFFDRRGGNTTTGGEVQDTQYISGQIGNGDPEFQASSDSTGDLTYTPGAIAYVLSSDLVEGNAGLGGNDDSSLTIRLVTDITTGAFVEGVGCRGNVEFVFTAGDRVLMNYTFTGRLDNQGLSTNMKAPVLTGSCSLNNYHTESGCTGAGGTWQPQTLPPAFVGVNLGIQDSSYSSSSAAPVTSLIFTTATINMGNEITVRENMNASSGYDVAYITGRNPTMTFNPDAVDSTTFGFWSQFLSGDVTRAEFTVGSSATPSTGLFTFRMPAMQFTGIADGNRDEVMVYDSTTTLTGGDYGSSIAHKHNHQNPASSRLSPRLGTNNEFVLFHH